MICHPERASRIRCARCSRSRIAGGESKDLHSFLPIHFLDLKFEGSAIYLHREDFQQALTKNALWVEVPRDMTRDQIEVVNDKYVICTGTFVASMHGHMGMTSGEMANVTRLEVWTLPGGH
jgi:hypothetical protein